MGVLRTLAVGTTALVGAVSLSGCASDGTAWVENDQLTTCYRGRIVPAEMVDGILLVEGDLEVTEAENVCPQPAQPDRELTGRRAPSTQGTVWGASTYGVRWEGGVVPYQIDSAFSSAENQRILDAMDHWSDLVPGISFRPSTSADPSWVRFVRGGSCSSGYGRVTGQRTISLTSGCTNSFSVHHEIGHALGLQHEHTRSDRDSFVTVSSSGNNFSIDTGANMFEYDFDSVMHYSLSSSISLAPGVTLPTGVTVGQRNHLSVTDIDSMRAMYPKAIVHRTVFASAGQTVSLCRLLGREQDAATKFALTSTGWNRTPEFDGDEIQFGSQVETGPMHRHCRIRSNFWANDYDYPNDDSSQYGSSSSSNEMFVDEQDIMILSAGLAPVIL